HSRRQPVTTMTAPDREAPSRPSFRAIGPLAAMPATEIRSPAAIKARPPAAVSASTGSSTSLSSMLVELAVVGALVATAALIRWINLWSVPIFTDEGDESDLALRIFHEGARPLTN